MLVSDDVLQWTGRLVTLYAVYRDPDDPATDATAWPTWDLQHEAGNLVWVGVVRGISRQRGGVWELSCHGRDALMRRTLGAVTSATWMPITAELTMVPEQAGFGVWWDRRAFGEVPTAFNGSIFATDLTATTKAELADEIDAIISDAVDGTSTNFAGLEGDLDTYTIGADAQDADAGVDSNGFWVRKADQVSDQEILTMWVVMHSRVWRQLGYEPETQNYDDSERTSDNRQIVFRELTADTGFAVSTTYDTGFVAPGPGYWVAKMTTVKTGFAGTVEDANYWDSDGARRYYCPKFSGEPYTLDMSGNGQIVRLGGGASPYIEGQLSVYHDGGDVNGSPATRARFFAFRGKVLEPKVGSGGAVDFDGEPRDEIGRAHV